MIKQFRSEALDMFIGIPGPEFLILFPLVSLVAIGIGYWLQHHDNTGQYNTPSACSLSILETAAIRAERKGVIYVGLFQLWQKGIITVRGKASHAYVHITHDMENVSLEDDIEKILYRYIISRFNQQCEPKRLFQLNSSLHLELDKALQTTYTKLEQRHLRCSDEEFQKRQSVVRFVLLSIIGVGGLKLGFGLWYGHPVGFLVFLLVLMPLAAWFILSNPNRQTILGRRYLKKCKSKLYTSNLLRNEEEGVWQLAVFGVKGLKGWVVFKAYFNAFIYSDQKTSSNSSSNGYIGGCGGGCGGGSSDSGGGSSGGGCGGCGGGS